MSRAQNVNLTAAAAGLCIFGGIGWGFSTGDWLMGALLFLIGLANLARMFQLRGN